jgi:hypothetical protein
MTPTFAQLKSRILMLEESIRNRLIELNSKKTRVTQDEQLAIRGMYDRLKRGYAELKAWGVGNVIVVVTIKVWEIQPYQLNSLAEGKTYTIYYSGVSPEEAKELIEIHFPKSEILSINTYQTGTKITTKI